MTDLEFRLKPMLATQSIPVHWEFTQNDYDKLANGRRANWSVFLRDDVVHICRVGGEELYRFVIRKANEGIYMADALEAYVPDDFYESARLHGWSEGKIEQHRIKSKSFASKEVKGLLENYFGIYFNN